MRGDPETIRSVPSIKVFGSSVVRVAPDKASIVVAVSRVEPTPEAAFAKAREAARDVTAYLQKSALKDFGSSRVTLSQDYKYNGRDHEFVGYQAKIDFNIVVREMDKVDTVLAGVIAAGANLLASVRFQSTRLKDLRAETRRRAIAAAREKAELYCASAGVSVGSVLYIEDANPDVLTGRGEGDTYEEDAIDDDARESGGFDPGAIAIGAAVYVVYRIEARA